MRRARRCLIGLVAVAALLAPGSASAVQELTQANFSVNATNGYRLNVTTLSFGKRQSDVFVTLKRGGGSASYIAKNGKASEGKVRANFGSLGRIRMKFKPNSSGEGGDCNSRTRGTFVGVLRFRGEDRFAEASARKARGVLKVRTFGPCRDRIGPRIVARPTASAQRDVAVGIGGNFPPNKLRNATVLAACGPDPGISYFGAKAGRRVTHSATIFEPGGRVSVVRSVYAAGPRSTFRFSKDLSTATITPRGLFTGTGRYTTLGFLSGDLSASFPGRPERVALTPGEAALSDGFDFDVPSCEDDD